MTMGVGGELLISLQTAVLSITGIRNFLNGYKKLNFWF